MTVLHYVLCIIQEMSHMKSLKTKYTKLNPVVKYAFVRSTVNEIPLACIVNGRKVVVFVLVCVESHRDNAEFGHYLAELSSYGVKRLCKFIRCFVLCSAVYTM